ncbi:MAG: hypothetical protein FMNOHCHN_03654 [Ignavibacteriaceae bacterium]|nr:hypothetical protein [Ignavibacteriaceae bacterium]
MKLDFGLAGPLGLGAWIGNDPKQAYTDVKTALTKTPEFFKSGVIGAGAQASQSPAVQKAILNLIITLGIYAGIGIGIYSGVRWIMTPENFSYAQKRVMASVRRKKKAKA